MRDYGFRTRRLRLEELENRRVLATLAIPSVTPGELQFPLSADQFDFEAEAGRLYSFTANPGTLEAPGIQVLEPGDPNTFATESTVVWLAPSDGTFILQVNDADFAFADFSQDDYRYTITAEVLEYDDDHGNSLASATDVALPTAIQGQIEIATDVDVFRVSGMSGLVEVADGSQLEDVEFVIRDENGSTIDSVPGISSRWNLASDGEFFVEIRSRGEDATDYAIDLSQVDYVDDVGNGPDFATSVAALGSISGSLETEGDVDVFSLNAIAGETYEFTNEVVLTITAPDGATSIISPSGISPMRWSAPQDGTYFVEVSSNAAPRDYAIEAIAIEPDDHGNTASTSTSIMASTTVNGVFDASLDADLFAFDATSGSTLTITTTGDELLAYEVELLDTDQTNRLLVRSVRGNSETILTLINDGTFYVRLSTSVLNVGGDGSYTLSIELSPATTSGDDHGNDVESATPIGVPSNTPVVGEIDFETDFFSFEANEGTIYSVAVTGNTRASVVGSNGLTLAAISFSSPLYWAAPADGTYFIESRFFFGEREYELNLEALEFDDDHGNTESVAAEVGVASTTTGSIDVIGDVDVFSFQAEAGVRYAINTTTQVNFIEAELFGESDLNRIDEGNAIEWIAPDDATYFVHIASFNNRATGEYSLTIEESPYDDDHPSAISLVGETPLLLPASLTGSIEVDGDFDFFRFEAIEDTLYNLVVTPTDDDGVAAPKVQVYAVDGSPITSERSLNTWIAPDSGTYFLRVGNSTRLSPGSPVGGYELTVESVAYDDDHGNSTALATPIAGPTTINGIAEVDGDVDYFSFTPTAFERYEFTAVGEADVVLGFADSVNARRGIDDDANISWLNVTAIDGSPAFLNINDKPDGEFGAYTIEFEIFAAGDLNKDNTVDSADLGRLLNSFGDRAPSFPQWEEGDLNGDRLVNSTDLGLLLNNFGSVRESASDGGEATVASVEDESGDVNSTKAAVAKGQYSPASPTPPFAARDFFFALDDEEE